MSPMKGDVMFYDNMNKMLKDGLALENVQFGLWGTKWMPRISYSRAHDIMLSSSFVWCMIDQIRVTFNNCYMIIGLRMDGQEKNVANEIQQLEDYCNAPWIIPDVRWDYHYFRETIPNVHTSKMFQPVGQID